MKKIKLLFLGFICLLFMVFFVSCSSKDNYVSDAGGTDNNVVIETTRKIYYTVDIVFECDDIVEASDKFRDKALAYDGYVSSSQITVNEGEKSTGTIIYKIPTDKLNEFLDFIDEENGVRTKNITTTDITSKYNQVEARIETLTASRKAYVELLENASSTSEIISLQTRIEEIDEELLYLDKEKSAYDTLLEFSTVTIRFNAEYKERLLEGYGDYLVNFFKAIFTVIMYLLPVAFVGGVIVCCVIFPKKIIKKLKEKKIK